MHQSPQFFISLVRMHRQFYQKSTPAACLWQSQTYQTFPNFGGSNDMQLKPTCQVLSRWTQRKCWYTIKKYSNAEFQKNKPGVVVFEGEQTAIKFFLENAKGMYPCVLIQIKCWWSPGLRYLDFRHLDTKPLLINSDNKIRLADSKPGLHEVENMNELLKALDAIGEKDWFRQQMGMKRQVVCPYYCLSAHPWQKTWLLKPSLGRNQERYEKSVNRFPKYPRDPGRSRPWLYKSFAGKPRRRIKRTCLIIHPVIPVKFKIFTIIMSLDYPITRSFSWRWFTPISLAGSFIVIAILSVVNSNHNLPTPQFQINDWFPFRSCFDWLRDRHSLWKWF